MPEQKQTQTWIVTLGDGREVEIDANREPTMAEVQSYLKANPLPVEKPTEPEPTMRGELTHAVQNPGETLGKAISSTGRLVKNIAVDLPQTVWELNKLKTKFISGTSDERQQVADQLKEIVKAGFGAEKDRLVKMFSSPGQFTKAFLDDPAGIISDIAGVASVAGGGLKLAATRLPAASRAASVAGKLAGATEAVGKLDPVVAGMKLAAKGTQVAARVPTLASLRPEKSLLKGFDVTKAQLADRVNAAGITNVQKAEEVAKAMVEGDTALAKRLVEEGHEGLSWEKFIDAYDKGLLREEANIAALGANKKLTRKLDVKVGELRGQHQRTAARPEVPPVQEQIPTSEEAVSSLVKAQSELGPTARTIPNVTFGQIDPAIRGRVEQLGPQANLAPPRFMANPQGVRIGGRPAQPATFAEFPLDKGLALKRQLAAEAYERGARGKGNFGTDIARTGAQNIKQQIADVAPELAASSQKTQEALSVEQAYKAAAKNRPNRTGAGTSALVTGLVTGNPFTGLAVQGALSAAESPRLGTSLGIGMHRAGSFAARPEIIQIVRAMRAAGRSQDEIDRAVLEAELGRGKR